MINMHDLVLYLSRGWMIEKRLNWKEYLYIIERIPDDDIVNLNDLAKRSWHEELSGLFSL